MTDAYDLQRFVEAQNQDFEWAFKELKAGYKRGHWMWHIFPQIQGLGSSAMSQKYAISSQDEAKAYSEHPILGPRLRQLTQLVINVEGRTIGQIFYYPDDLKFRSCMTLFSRAALDPSIFLVALRKYFNGVPDQLTLEILEKG